MSIKHRSILLTAVTCLLALTAGCTRHVSRDISSDGKAGEVIFPSTERLVLKEGTFPNVDSLRTVGPGVSKDQLYELLGRPHFREGYYGVREWDYLFHFRTPDGIVTCQYKVIFDDNYHGQNFHWAPASCADQLKRAPSTAVAPPQQLRFEVSGDALFAFDRHGSTDILPGGRQEIAEIAAKLKAANAATVQVIGHTDMLGSETYNQGLSQQRALTVRQLLVDGGVSAATVVAIGAGESQPLRTCETDTSHAVLVACLQPNRRVEIVASGLK